MSKRWTFKIGDGIEDLVHVIIKVFATFGKVQGKVREKGLTLSMLSSKLGRLLELVGRL